MKKTHHRKNQNDDCRMAPDIVVSVRHYGTQRDEQIVRAAATSSRSRVLAASLLAGMVVAAVCCVVFLGPAQSGLHTELESDQDSIDALLNKIDKLTATQQGPASHHTAALVQHAAPHHVRLSVESPAQKFLDEVCCTCRTSPLFSLPRVNPNTLFQVNGITSAEATHSTEEPVLHVPRARPSRPSSSAVSGADPKSIIKQLHKTDAASDPVAMGIPTDPSNLSPSAKAKVKAELEKIATALKTDFKSDVAFADKAGYLPPIPGHPGV